MILDCRADILPGHSILDPQQLLGQLVRGEVNPRHISVKEERELRCWCREQSRASAESLARLKDLGHFRNARRARRRHLERKEVQLEALFLAARKRWPVTLEMSSSTRERIRLRRLQSVFEMLPKVGRLDRRARANQFLIDKGHGGEMRRVTSFHWVDRARQLMLRSALFPFANLHPSQFMLARDRARRGPAAVRKALLAALSVCEEGSLFLQFDVKDFYGSISHRWLEQALGLPQQVVQRQVHTGQMQMATYGDKAIVHASHEATREGGQWGIPQGSALSTLVAEMVMADVLQSIAALDNLPIFAWSDNIGVIVPRWRGREIESLVREGFASHGAGPFKLGMARQENIARGFSFLGVNYVKKPGADPRAFVPIEIASAWRISIGEIIMRASIEDLERIDRHIIAKKAAWGWWDGWPAIERQLTWMMRTVAETPWANGETLRVLPRRR